MRGSGFLMAMKAFAWLVCSICALAGMLFRMLRGQILQHPLQFYHRTCVHRHPNVFERWGSQVSETHAALLQHRFTPPAACFGQA